MIEYKDYRLLFLKDFNVPFTNNLAEQTIRLAKMKRKVSGQNINLERANDFAIILSIIQTAKINNKNILIEIQKKLSK